MQFAGIIGAKIELFSEKMPNILDQILHLYDYVNYFLIMILGIGPILHTVELGMVDVVQWLIGCP